MQIALNPGNITKTIITPRSHMKATSGKNRIRSTIYPGTLEHDYMRSRKSVTQPLSPGDNFPEFFVKTRDNETTPMTRVSNTHNEWQMVVIYRGKHCPKCSTYLNELNNLQDDFKLANIDTVAVSADSVSQLNTFLDSRTNSLNFKVLAGLSEYQMSLLGLYVSQPESLNDTDHPFSEPCVFVINPNNKLQVIDKSNAPFSRPDPQKLLEGIKFIKSIY